MPIIETSGARLSYTRVGEGPAVLFVQGVGIVGEGWRPQVDALKSDFTCFSFDNRGIGGSTILGPHALSVEAMADDALAILEGERVERFHLVGHSLGGVIAQEIALRVPERVRSLALLCTFARGKQGARLTWDILVAGLKTKIGTRAMRRKAFLELVMPDKHLAALSDIDAYATELAPLFGHDLADSPAIATQQLSALGRYDALDRLSSLSVPTLVASAAHDRIALPEFGRELAAAIPGSRYVELEDAGHGVPIHRAEVVTDLLREHFGSAVGAGVARR
jgi:pimeloyl-ACP methyl ester carboxylesterase